MPVEVVMPRLSQTEDEGLVVAWFKREGSEVKAGDLLLEVQVEKVSYEIEAPAGGQLSQILAPKGAVAKVDQVLAVIAEATEAPATEAPATEAPATEAPATEAPATEAPAVTQQEPVPSPQPAKSAVPVSPAARRLAKEHGIDLAAVQGTGDGDRITEADVQRAAPVAAAPAIQVIPIAGLRKAVAQRMHSSLQTMAQVSLATETDVTDLVRAREARRAQLDVSYTDLIIRAVALTLKEHPRLNATATAEEIRLHSEVHIGLAVALDDGLIAPVLRHADRMGVAEIAAEARRLAERARAGALTADDLVGGTFTVTNLGAFEIDAFTPIINPPQVAILGVGRILEKPALHQGAITARSLLTLSLTFDHRVVDGAPAAAFLQALSRRLGVPEDLFR